MKTLKLSSPFLSVAALLSILVLSGIGAGINTVQSIARRQSPFKKEKKFINRVGNHIPLKVKVRNLEKDNWAKEFELEVTNTADKPIYFLDFFLVMPESASTDGVKRGFSLRYGRIQLVDFNAPLQPDDVPIKPHETYIFKIPESQVEGWLKSKAKGRKSDPQKLELIFAGLNFGDGTGFSGTDGVPIPNVS